MRCSVLDTDEAVNAEVVPRESWMGLFNQQGMNNPTPRMQMLDGLNEGLIRFSADDALVHKGTTSLADVVAQWTARG